MCLKRDWIKENWTWLDVFENNWMNENIQIEERKWDKVGIVEKFQLKSDQPF